MIPNMLELAQNCKFLRISRFPENFWKDSRNIWIFKFWLQNQFQWLKLSGNDTQCVGIGPKQQFLENFQISGKFLEKFLDNWNFEILSSKSSSVTKTEWEKYPIHWNWSKSANSRQFPDFPISRFQIPENHRCRQKCAKLLWICCINCFCKYLAKNHRFW